MPDISKMGRRQELECFTMTTAVRTNSHQRSATPIFSTVGALVAKIAFAVRGDEDRKAGWMRSGIPRLPNAADIKVAKRNTLRQCVNPERLHRHGPRASDGDPEFWATIGIDRNIENDLPAAVRNLAEVLRGGRSGGGAQFCWFGTCHLLPRAISPRPRSARRSGRLALSFGNGTRGRSASDGTAPRAGRVACQPSTDRTASAARPRNGRPCARRGGAPAYHKARATFAPRDTASTHT